MSGGLRRLTVSVLCLFVLVFSISRAQAVEVRRVVAGDLEAWLVEDHSNPMIAVSIAFLGGAALDPSGKEGLARMTASVLDEGAGDMDSQAFQLRLEELSITLQFDAGRDTFGGTLRTLTGNRDEAFALLKQALTAPRFDPEPVARMKSQLQALLRRQAENPGSIANKRFFSTVFPDHPYGRSVGGTEQSIAAITVDDMRTFVAERLTRDNLVIGVAGDITPDELSRLLTSTFAELPEKAAPNGVPNTEAEAEAAIVVVEQPARQSAIIFGQRGLKRDNPDYYAATVMNRILGGGGFTSRLYQEVRDKRGLAYSVRTSLVPLAHAGLIVGSAGTANERAGETIEVVRDQWRRMAEEGATAEEIADAKTYLVGSFPLRFTSNGSIAGILAAMQIYDLGIDYLDRRNALMEGVTLDDVNRVAEDVLDPSALTMIVVGEPEGLMVQQP